MRFISIDDISYLEYDVLGGLNLWTYCNNNPIMYVDPDGTLFFSLTALIVGAIVGATIAFGTVAYLDYKDDGKIFNGSIKWYDYFGATLLGGVIGAIAGAAIGGIAGMSFSVTIPTIGFVNAGGALSIGITGSVTLTVSGAQVLAGAGLVGLSIMMAKKSRLSGKETSSDKPSWLNSGMIDKNISPQQNATNLLNEKYGNGNWGKGPKTEYNRIIKWIIRWVLR